MESKHDSSEQFVVYRTPGTANLGAKKRNVILELSEDVVQKRFSSAKSGTDLNFVQFSVNIDGKSLVDSNVRVLFENIKVEVKGECTGTTQNKDNLVAAMKNKFGFSSNPIWSSCSTLSVGFNNKPITRNPDQYINAFNAYVKSDQNYQLSSYPLSPDYLPYNDTSEISGAWLNSLNSEENNANKYGSRSAFLVNDYANTSVSSGAPGTFTYIAYATICAPIPLNIFSSAMQGSHIANLEQLDISFQLNLQKMFNCWATINAGDSAVFRATKFSSVTASVASAPKLLYSTVVPNNALTPYLFDVNTGLPYNTVYPLITPAFRIGQNFASLTAGQSIRINSQTMSTNSVPSHLLIFATRERPMTSDVTSGMIAPLARTQTFGLIEDLNINFMNKNYTFSNSVQLYDLAAKNGLYRTFNTVNKYSGAPILIDCSKDLGLNGYMVAQKLSMNIQCDAQVKNLSGSTEGYRLDCVLLNAGKLTIGQQVTEDQSLSLTEADTVLLNNSVSESEVNRSQSLWIGASIDGQPMFGGGFWGDLWSGIKSVASNVYDNVIKPTASVALPVIAKTALPLLSKVVSGGQSYHAYNSGGDLEYKPMGAKVSSKPRTRKGGAIDNSPFDQVN